MVRRSQLVRFAAALALSASCGAAAEAQSGPGGPVASLGSAASSPVMRPRESDLRDGGLRDGGLGDAGPGELGLPASSRRSNPLDPSTSAAAAQGQVIEEVRVEGNQTTPLTKVQSYLKSRAGRELDAELVQADVRRLTQSGLFRDVRTSTKPGANGGTILVFQVIERPVISEILFIGNRGIKDSVLVKQSDLKKGDALNQYSVEEGRRKIEEFYHSKGFPKTTVSIVEGNQPNDRRVVYVVNEDQLQRIESVNFVGNEIVSSSRLKTMIESKPGFLWYFFKGKVDRKKIDDDIEKLTAYYRSLGYFRARISRELEYDETNSWLTLTFVIDEGPRYVVRNVSVMGHDKFTEEQLMEKLELKSGEYFNQAKMNRDVMSIRDTYGSQGYIFADVQPDPRFLEEPGELDLVYHIKEGEPWRVGTIKVKIAGDYPHTRHSTVLNRISLRPGDIIDNRELRKSEQRIKSSQLFEIDPTKGNPPQLSVIPPDLKDLEQSVTERPKSKSRSGTAFRGQNP